MSSPPRISIAMAVYNGVRFIREQLDSFVHQTCRPDELIISDNCSTDSTIAIIQEFARHAPFPVRLFINERNLGVTRNFERAISECSGDIIFLSDCDDVWYPEKIRVMTAALTVSSKAGIAVCDAALVDEKLKSLGRGLWQAWGFTLSSRRAERLANGESFDPSVPWFGACMAFRAPLRALILPMPCGSDFERAGYDSFIARTIVCSGAAGAAMVSVPLQAYRQHSAQMSGVAGLSLTARFLDRFKGRSRRPTLALAPVIDRLSELASTSAAVDPSLLAEALRHFRARCDLPARKRSRIPVIMEELAAFRYHRFSGGLGVALKDLIFVR